SCLKKSGSSSGFDSGSGSGFDSGLAVGSGFDSEVDSILHIPFDPFLKTMAEDRHPEHRSIKEMYTFTFGKYQIWGASARMLRQIFMLLSKKN
ncbi:hypothetical protein AAA799O18_00773, partial [Marine Group I thaumarchaeote SCGC AAA799-O18]